LKRKFVYFLALFFAENAAFAQPVKLHLSEAIGLAIQNNLTTRLAQAETDQARGQAIQAASALLPHVMATVGQSRVFKVNLEAQGFTGNQIPGFNPLLGPFDVFDARLQLSQKIFDLTAIRNNKSARAREDAARWQEKLAREQVATAAALAYLEQLRADRSVAAEQANLALSERLQTLARDQHQAGIATGVDVARAETRAAQDNVLLIRARVAANEASLRLKRVIGLPLSESLELADTLQASTATLPKVDNAIQIAGTQRVELEFFLSQQRAAALLADAAKAGHLPSIEAVANYGWSGNLPSSTARTGSIGGTLSLPIYYGGHTRGQITTARALQQEAESRYRDSRIQVEEDVRLALQTLTTEVEEVRTAYSVVSLAERELRMAKDRYLAGVGDNIQLTSAQTSLAQARDILIDALTRFNTARVNLATALGEMQTFQL
jgi:outer membrane protein